jgi:phosphoenolpyruvate carboxykinase (GTP)
MFIDIKFLNCWIDQWKKILNPDNVVWYFGTPEQKSDLLDKLKNISKVIDSRPNTYAFFSDPSDVARMESRTFICSKSKSDSGKTNNWEDPSNMFYNILMPKLSNVMVGRTMYLIPFSMGNPETGKNIYGIEITDQPYVCLSMGIMTRIGSNILDSMDKFIPCVHTSGSHIYNDDYNNFNSKLSNWPCSKDKYICHFPDGIDGFDNFDGIDNSAYIISYGSSYGGNALLSKKCLALRIASKIGFKQGWLAEHCLILKIISPNGLTKYYLGSFPSSCGKTNLAMCDPCETIKKEGWKIETIGDDIAWIFVIDGKLYALNPENGFFGVAPGTSEKTNSNAMKALNFDCIFTNVGTYLDSDGKTEVWWEGLDNSVLCDSTNNLTTWKNQMYWDNKNKTDEINKIDKIDKIDKIAHPNSRYTIPITNCPCLAGEYDKLVEISGIIYGGRRTDTIPLVSKANNYLQGIFYGATLSSEETSASIEGKIGNIRFDPMAMKPFIGYNIDDYLTHWINIIENLQTKPEFFLVNWFRKDSSNQFIWDGYNSNAIVLKWIFENNNLEKTNGFFGQYPMPNDLNIDQNKWNELFVDPDEKIYQYTGQIKKYIGEFDNFPKQLENIYWKMKNNMKK